MESSSQEFDVIKKPRNNYSSHALRRAVPNINIQQKKESITMHRLKMLSFLKPDKHEDLGRKVKTVENIPKILTILPGPPERHYMQIDEEDEEILDTNNDILEKQSQSSGSSIDGDEDDEDRLYQ